MEMLLWWGNGGQFEFVSWPARFKKRTGCCFNAFFCVCFYHYYKKRDQRIHQNTGSLITYQHFWCLFARHREKEKIRFWCCERYIPAPLSWSPGGKLTPELWLVESLVDQLWICPFVCLPLYSLPLSFVCVLSQSNRTKGRSPGVNMSSLFDLPGLPFGSLENRGMKVNCKFL